MSLIADVFITTKNRPELLDKTLNELFECTDKNLFRLTIVQDGHDEDTSHVISSYEEDIDFSLKSYENQGLGPSINMTLAHIETLNNWYNHPTHGDQTKVSSFICYIQDDILVSPDWLPKMVKFFTLFEHQHKLGFASGVECVEHQEGLKDLGNGMQLKKYIRAASMFGRREYWMSMFPIPRLDPETGRVRAKPNDGMGSGADWHFVRNHPNSVEKTGKNCLVFPSMMTHVGYNNSTWLKRELPESDQDKRIISEKMNT